MEVLEERYGTEMILVEYGFLSDKFNTRTEYAHKNSHLKSSSPVSLEHSPSFCDAIKVVESDFICP